MRGAKISKKAQGAVKDHKAIGKVNRQRAWDNIDKEHCPFLSYIHDLPRTSLTSISPALQCSILVVITDSKGYLGPMSHLHCIPYHQP